MDSLDQIEAPSPHTRGRMPGEKPELKPELNLPPYARAYARACTRHARLGVYSHARKPPPPIGKKREGGKNRPLLKIRPSPPIVPYAIAFSLSAPDFGAS